MAKKWKILKEFRIKNLELRIEDILQILLKNRGLTTKKNINSFLNPPDPYSLTAKDVGIDKKALTQAIKRIEKAIENKESVVVYTDYDADGITAGAIMWETLHKLSAHVMPYTPHRVEEGYGLSVKGIDNVKKQYNPTLIITVDHGITAWEKVAYAKKQGIETIVTDHHVEPKRLPDCMIVHTTEVCGAGVAWFVAKELLDTYHVSSIKYQEEMLALAAIGTIADMMPLIGANRAIAKFGLEALNKTQRVGLKSLIAEAGLTPRMIKAYEVSHILAPRLNAMGRLVHALDALRLLCTKDSKKAQKLSQVLGLTNRERQQLTMDTTLDAKGAIELRIKNKELRKLLFVAHAEYNQGVIGLVAGKLVEEYYRPAIVITRGEVYSKASARSISGFNIIEAIRSCSDILVDAGGHPMAAGFTIETSRLKELQIRLEELADKTLTDNDLIRTLRIDLELPLEVLSEELWQVIRDFEPFGMANPEPVFATRNVKIADIRLVGKEGRHIKFKFIVQSSKFKVFDAIGFGMGELYGQLRVGQTVDIAYTLDMNVWNGSESLQLKLKDINSKLSSKKSGGRLQYA